MPWLSKQMIFWEAIILLILFADFVWLCIPFLMVNTMNEGKKIVKMNVYIWLNKIYNHVLSYVYLYIFCHNYIWHCVGWQFDNRSVWLKYYICFTVFRRRQDGGLFHPSPYVGYPFFMIPDLGNFCSPYLSNGALGTNARTVSIFAVYHFVFVWKTNLRSRL